MLGIKALPWNRSTVWKHLLAPFAVLALIVLYASGTPGKALVAAILGYLLLDHFIKPVPAQKPAP